MLTHSFWWLAVDALAVYRLAILSSKDKITDPARHWLCIRAFTKTADPAPGKLAAMARWLYELVICPWCVSIWLGAAVVALTRFVPGAWQYAALALAFSGVAGFLAER
jgi:hypothetical protein